MGKEAEALCDFTAKSSHVLFKGDVHILDLNAEVDGLIVELNDALGEIIEVGLCDKEIWIAERLEQSQRLFELGFACGWLCHWRK